MGISRRQVLGVMGAASAAAILPIKVLAQAAESKRAVRIATISPITFRLTVSPIINGKLAEVPQHGFLVDGLGDHTVLEAHGEPQPQSLKCGDLRIEISSVPLALTVFNKENQAVQKIVVDTDSISFSTGNGPLLALGEGGPQFDRRGDRDTMKSGSDGYHLQSHGSRVPIPWLIGTEGWAIFFHQPLGTFDLTGSESRFLATEPGGVLDLFVVVSKDPKKIMAEYARLTGHPELPPLWSLGYLQSHRTLGDREPRYWRKQRQFREKKTDSLAMR